MPCIVIVLSDALTDLAGRHTDHRIERQIVIGTAAEDVYPQRPFLEIARLPLQGTLHDVAQKIRISPAITESRTLQDAFELLAYGALVLAGFQVRQSTVRNWTPKKSRRHGPPFARRDYITSGLQSGSKFPMLGMQVSYRAAIAP